MAMRKAAGMAWKPDRNWKGTSIGNRNVKFSSMNKKKKANFKKYRGQGK